MQHLRKFNEGLSTNDILCLDIPFVMYVVMPEIAKYFYGKIPEKLSTSDKDIIDWIGCPKFVGWEIIDSGNIITLKSGPSSTMIFNQLKNTISLGKDGEYKIRKSKMVKFVKDIRIAKTISDDIVDFGIHIRDLGFKLDLITSPFLKKISIIIKNEYNKEFDYSDIENEIKDLIESISNMGLKLIDMNKKYIDRYSINVPTSDPVYIDRVEINFDV